ncbi:MAG: hypothetical protein HY911_04355 [Desulfobacterales bacterium]|nr:hypothetical protein [Desulfobacterales bacterium]
MPLYVNSEDQKTVNEIRITLAQVLIDLGGIRVSDEYSHRTRSAMIGEMRKVNQMMDSIGMQHSFSKRDPLDPSRRSANG